MQARSKDPDKASFFTYLPRGGVVLEMGEPGNDCGGAELRMQRPFAEKGQRSQATNNQVS